MIKVTAYMNPESIVINSLRDLAATTTEDGWKIMLKFRDENEMKAFARRTQLSFSRKHEDDAGNANGGGLLHHPDRHTALL